MREKGEKEEVRVKERSRFKDFTLLALRMKRPEPRKAVNRWGNESAPKASRRDATDF